jgi:hypothetical protein
VELRETQHHRIRKIRTRLSELLQKNSEESNLANRLARISLVAGEVFGFAIGNSVREID